MRKILLSSVCAILALCLSGCKFDVLKPSGDIAAQQRDLLIISTLLMLLIIVPVMIATVKFAWHYRASNKNARYEPDWDHSTKLELLIWAFPLLIIICLGALTWLGTHLLDPYRPLSRLSPEKEVAKNVRPLEVQVVALDWKWLFIYPEYNVAVVNELAAPVDRPIDFRITSSSVMNAFYVPALSGMIYAMPGMETKLHAVINHAGNYQGFSANYSGDGFSHMKFRFIGTDQPGFESWLSRAKADGKHLDRAYYLKKLEIPTEKEPVAYYASVDKDLFPAILNMCVDPGKMCMGTRMAIDAQGGLGKKGIDLVSPLSYDKYARRGEMPATGNQKTYITNICRVDELPEAPPLQTRIPSTAPLRGYGLSVPSNNPLAQTGKPFSTSTLRSEDLPSDRPVTAMEGR